MYKVAGLFVKSRGSARACCLSHTALRSPLRRLSFEGLAAYLRPVACFEGSAIHKNVDKCLHINIMILVKLLDILSILCFRKTWRQDANDVQYVWFYRVWIIESTRIQDNVKVSHEKKDSRWRCQAQLFSPNFDRVKFLGTFYRSFVIYRQFILEPIRLITTSDN